MSEPKHSPLPWRLEITDDVDRESCLVYAKVVDADGDTVFGQWSSKGELVQVNLSLIVDAVNRQVPLPDAELEAICSRIRSDREWRDKFPVDPPPRGRRETDGLYDRERLLAENERLLGLLDDLFRDHAALSQDAAPTVRVREENVRLRESLRKIVDMHEAPRPLTWSALASAMRDAAREALGEGV